MIERRDDRTTDPWNYGSNRNRNGNNVNSYCVVEMESLSIGLSLAARAMGNEGIELAGIPFPGSPGFIGIFQGKRSELITVMDAVFDGTAKGVLRKTHIPSPEVDLLTPAPREKGSPRTRDVGIVETGGFGIMLRCVDMALKCPGVEVLSSNYDVGAGRGAILLGGTVDILTTILEEMRGICGYTEIIGTSVLPSPPAELTMVFSSPGDRSVDPRS